MKKFNIVGTCIPKENYMVDTSKRLEQIYKMVENKDYFVINRPRQFGKTTTLALLEHMLLASEEYFPIGISFEGWGDTPFSSEARFCSTFLFSLGHEFNVERYGYNNLFLEQIPTADSLNNLSIILKNILLKIPKKVVLMIDEVDKSSNNELFIHFLGMLREKYLQARKGRDITFHSIILAGVNDIRSLKQKMRPEAQSQQNSPWNIAVPFEIDMSFTPADIATMLADYVKESGVSMDITAVSERIFFWTSGYPFLVSRLCLEVAEKILPTKQTSSWTVEDIDRVAKVAKKETNTLFDVLTKNLETNKELYQLIQDITIGNREYIFELKNTLIKMAYMHGFITCNKKGFARIHNRIFHEGIISFFVSKIETGRLLESAGNEEKEYVKKNGKLDFDLVMTSFQEVIKEKYSKHDALKSKEFQHSNLRLLFLMYIDPIINGQGHSFKEVEIGAEKRLDIVVTYHGEIFVVEVKVWYGEKYHEQGKQQLKQYMKAMSIKKGYMLIINKNENKTFKIEKEDGIMMVHI